MKYKVGDKVRIKSLDWYYENRDKIDQIDCGNVCFVRNMATLCGKIVTISSILPMLEVYGIKEDDGNYKCCFSKSWDERHGACIQIMANRLFLQGRQCYDEYNGKNIKNGIRYYNGYPAKLQETIKPLKNK